MKAKPIGLEHEEKMWACQNTSGEVELSYTEIHTAYNSKDRLQGSSPPLSFPPYVLPTLAAWASSLNSLTHIRIKTKCEPINSLGDQDIWSWDKYDIISLPSGTEGAMMVLQWDVTEGIVSQDRGEDFA